MALLNEKNLAGRGWNRSGNLHQWNTERRYQRPGGWVRSVLLPYRQQLRTAGCFSRWNCNLSWEWWEARNDRYDQLYKGEWEWPVPLLDKEKVDRRDVHPSQLRLSRGIVPSGCPRFLKQTPVLLSWQPLAPGNSGMFGDRVEKPKIESQHLVRVTPRILPCTSIRDGSPR